MSNDYNADDNATDNTAKDPNEWTSGEERPTGAQMSYLRTMAEEANTDLPENISKAEASKLIDRLQEKTNRGQGN